jgi:serine/threonine protein kinase
MIESLGHYKILDRIGAGGIGEVYRARDTRVGRTVAIEVLAPETARNAKRRARFLEDARAAAALSHPNIATLYEVGEEKELTYIAREFVPGEPLTTTIASRSLNPRRAIDFATQLADAVADAHAEGIAHRNLKPVAITVTPKDKVKILDFGLAAWIKRGGLPSAPASEEADFQADILSLGSILYEMVTGKQPVPPNPAPPSSLNSGIPSELDPIVLKALSQASGRRYESAATLAAELRSVAAVLDVRSGAKEPPSHPAIRSHQRTVSPWLVAGLLLALMAIAALVWLATRAA